METTREKTNKIHADCGGDIYRLLVKHEDKVAPLYCGEECDKCFAVIDDGEEGY